MVRLFLSNCSQLTQINWLKEAQVTISNIGPKSVFFGLGRVLVVFLVREAALELLALL